MRLADAEVARLHSRSDRYRRKLDAALEIARTGVEEAGGTAFVAFSCGKDSAANAVDRGRSVARYRGSHGPVA